MPRKARVKSPESVYHIMCRSVSEFLLFLDNDDKDYYLDLLKRYTDKYKCSLCAYCLMDNHLHLHLDPRGFDLSKFMHSLNTAYVRYYNKKYNRHGHVFQERFESRVLDSDEYNFAVSAYIHNYAQDIPGFSGREETYPYSSYDIYLGTWKDLRQLVDISFMMDLFHRKNPKEFAARYLEFVSHQRDVGSLGELKKKLSGTIENEYVSGRKIILREYSPAQVISFISNHLAFSKSSLSTKAKRKLLQHRAFTAYALQVLCGLSYREICSSMYNITVSGCSRLCSRGYDALQQEPLYRELFYELTACAQ